MSKSAAVVSAMLALSVLCGCATAPKASGWEGKRIAVFGDSISDKKLTMWKQWWKFVGEELGAEMCVYAVNGRQWDDIPGQVLSMRCDNNGDVDAILVLMGTNDFNSDVPLGEWYRVTDETINRDGKMVTVKRRVPVFDDKTVRGRINIAMNLLKGDYPDRQIVLMTPLRRGYFSCAPTNVQPEDSYANELGLFIGDYAQVVREAGEIWAVPVFDSYSESGLILSMPAYSDCCNRAGTDRLHPSTEGCRRLGLAVSAKLKTLAPTYRK